MSRSLHILILLIALLTSPSHLLADQTLPDSSNAIALDLPAQCQLGETCWVVNYVDVDSSVAAKDFQCHERTYDGHDGVDLAIRDRGVMEQGVSVIAAVPATVRRVRDGAADVGLSKTNSQEAIALSTTLGLPQRNHRSMRFAEATSWLIRSLRMRRHWYCGSISSAYKPTIGFVFRSPHRMDVRFSAESYRSIAPRRDGSCLQVSAVRATRGHPARITEHFGSNVRRGVSLPNTLGDSTDFLNPSVQSDQWHQAQHNVLHACPGAG